MLKLPRAVRSNTKLVGYLVKERDFLRSVIEERGDAREARKAITRANNATVRLYRALAEVRRQATPEVIADLGGGGIEDVRARKISSLNSDHERALFGTGMDLFAIQNILRGVHQKLWEIGKFIQAPARAPSKFAECCVVDEIQEIMARAKCDRKTVEAVIDELFLCVGLERPTERTMRNFRAMRKKPAPK